MAMSNLTTQAHDNVTKGRSKYVGGSDVPVILCISKFKTQYQLALAKVGIVKSEFIGNEYTQFGNALEPQIRDYINLANEDGYQFIENTTIDNELGLRSNTDGVDLENKVLLEIKTHGSKPTIDIYVPQMQLYMYQNNLDKGLLALYERPKDFDVEFDSERLEIMTVNRDDQFIKKILKEIELFWKRVEWLKNNKGASEHQYNNCLNGGNKEMSKENTELSVKTTKMTMPEIEFNYDELASNLEENLKKYEGLTFTDKTATECNKTITELRKGKRLVDQYRLKTKKQLLGPVEEFEKKCKALNKKFDEVISPLKEQADKFEEKRKEEKREEIEEISRELYKEHGLNTDTKLDFDDKWLNKSTSMKSIKEDIALQVEQMKLQQEKEKLDKQLIKSHVELMNAKNNVELLETSYVHLAGNTETDEIKRLIEQDAETLVKRKEEEDRLERERKEKEQKEEAEEKETVKQTVPDVEETGELFVEVYKVTGTESQLENLEKYMDQVGLKWSYEETEE